MNPTLPGTAARRELLDRFFATHNDAPRDQHEQFAELLAATGIGILPHRRGRDTVWYGFGTDERTGRELRGLLLAFAGPSYSDWSGQAAELDRDHPAEALLSVLVRSPVYRLTTRTQKSDELAHSLGLLAQLLRARPSPRAFNPRPRHRLLADLELALLAGHGPEADSLIDELVASGALSATNILFLRLRRLGATGQQRDLLEHPDLPDVLRRRRPRTVTVAIAKALRVRHVDPAIARWAAGDRDAPEQLKREFSELDAAWGAVLADALLETQDELLPVIALDHLLRGNASAAERLADRLPPTVRGLFDALLNPDQLVKTAPEAGEIHQPSVVGPTAGQDWRAAIERAVTDGNWKQVLATAADADDDPIALAYVIRAAYNLDTYGAALLAIECLARASEDSLVTARADKLFRDSEGALRATIQPADGDGMPAPESFVALFELIRDRGSVPQAREWAERGRYEWPHADLEDRAFVRRLAGAIEGCGSNDAAHTDALAALAHLLDWIDRAPDDEPLVDVLAAALDLVIYAGDATAVRDTLTVRLIESSLEARNDPELLKARLPDLLELWLAVAAPKRLDWPLAILDLAVGYGGNAPIVREFCSKVIGSCMPWADRLDLAQLGTLRSFASELSLEEAGALLPTAEPHGEAGDPLAALRGKLIGLYTLMQGAGIRARDILLQRCPGAEIEINGDTVATQRLRSLSEKADVMVVAYRSAQHAATDAIVAVRGRENTVPAQGKGSVALVRAVENWVANAEA